MEKILKVALQNCKPSLDAVMTVINATPNPAIAAELLLGIYEQPVLNSLSDKLDLCYQNPIFQDYNPVSDTVTFTYLEAETKQGWFLKDETQFVSDNVVAIGWSSERGHADYCEKYPESKLTYNEFKANYIQKEFIVKLTGAKRTGTVRLRDWQ